MDVLDRVPSMQRIGAHARTRHRLSAARNSTATEHADKHGIDKPEIDNWD
jgi:hypothetical protein